MKASHFVFASLIIIGILAVSLWKQHGTIQTSTSDNIASQEPAALPEADAGIPTNNSSLAEPEKMSVQERLELMRSRREAAKRRAEHLAEAGTHTMAEPVSDNGTNSLEHLLEVLSDTDSSSEANSRRSDAAQKLRALGQEAVAGLPKFVDLLRSGNEQTAYAGARALAYISESSPEAFQSLANALSDPDASVRDAACHGIGLLFNQQFKNVDTDSLLPIVLRNLQDSDRTVRIDSANAVNQYIEVQQRLGKTAEPEVVVPALVQSLGDENSSTRLAAILGIAKYGDKAQAVAPEISKLLQDSDPQVQRAAKTALQQITPIVPAQP